LDVLLTEQVIEKKKPFLGICLGMQLIVTTGYEPIETAGLGWVKGEVVKIEGTQNRIPHLGWNDIDILNPLFFKDISCKDFYFIHSYHFNAFEANDIAAVIDYGSPKSIVACIQRDNIFATQFHPEKSQQAGLKVLSNFFSYYA